MKGAERKCKKIKEEFVMEGGTVEGGQEEQKGISPWFKRSCAHRERALLGLCGEGAGGSLEGCVNVFVCVSVYVVVFLCVQFAKPGLPYSIFLSART